MNVFYPKHAVYMLSVLSLFMLTSCANIPLKTIPPPSPTSKLRVWVQPFSGPGNWGTPHEDYVDKTIRRVEKFLEQTDIYEIVTDSDVKAVLGDYSPSRWELERNDWAFARDIGRALYADYVITIERNHERSNLGGNNFFFTIKIINIKTGKIFEAWSMTDRIDRSEHDRQKASITATYRDAFFSAKQDMLETAITKSQSRVIQDKNIAAIQPPADIPAKAEPKPQVTVPDVRKPEPLLPDKTVAAASKPFDVSAGSEPKPQVSAQEQPEKGGLKVGDKTPVIPREASTSGRVRLVIYDLESPENVRTVALILTEVLREELFRLKRFTLVNRETLQQILSEMALQQTGLIDEKQAVKTGKGLAASQVVTGRLGMLGKTYILQTKRIDVETFATLNIASTMFTQGQEEDVLSRLPDLAKSLAGLQQ